MRVQSYRTGAFLSLPGRRNEVSPTDSTGRDSSAFPQKRCWGSDL